MPVKPDFLEKYSAPGLNLIGFTKQIKKENDEESQLDEITVDFENMWEIFSENDLIRTLLIENDEFSYLD